MKLNKKGTTFVELLVSMLILFLLINSLGTFKVFVAKETKRAQAYSRITLLINNEIADIYDTEDWDTFQTKEIVVKDENDTMLVEYDIKGLTENQTEKINVVFTFKDFKKELNLERSIYYGE